MITTREVPAYANHAFMRHQVGQWDWRLEVEPLYEGTGKSSVLKGHRTTTAFVPVFNLLGCGSTPQAAKRRAMICLTKKMAKS